MAVLTTTNALPSEGVLIAGAGNGRGPAQAPQVDRRTRAGRATLDRFNRRVAAGQQAAQTRRDNAERARRAEINARRLATRRANRAAREAAEAATPTRRPRPARRRG